MTTEIPRDQEAAVARAMAGLLLWNEQFVAQVAGNGPITTEDALLHFVAACEEVSVDAPNEGAARRILHNVVAELKLRRRVADRLQQFLLTRAEDVLELRREAKRAAR